jgi:hypothetical protein
MKYYMIIFVVKESQSEERAEKIPWTPRMARRATGEGIFLASTLSSLRAGPLRWAPLFSICSARVVLVRPLAAGH